MSTMFFMRWLTTEPKGRQSAGVLLLVGVLFLIPFIAQVAGVVPQSTDAGPMLAITALASLIAGGVELLPRALQSLVVGGRLLAVAGIVIVVLWGVMKMI
jgi:hypothetical protein